ncbi:LacI family DNA-binding transcriptional regulator [Aestuariimicrobium soli]|uniref:LacI family DNA-binding transcriptional regulator n=1 Tax=Aestuariimicrobium soli TaxID=2035834 RepID=UPI003EBAC1AD
MISGGGRPRREPSLADVAKAAGVSAQTVSRVATGSDRVRPTTKERVVAAMQELGYRPNGAARALKYGRYRSIGVIMFTLASYGNVRTLSAVADEADRGGYSLSFISLRAATEASLSGAFHRLAEQAVDGVIILIESHVARDAAIRIPPGMPVVVIDSSADGAHPFVDTDQAQGARQATEHLLDLGHETVFHIAGPEGSYSAQRRLAAWQAVLEERGLRVPVPFVGDWSADSGRAAGEWLARMPDATAVFAANDQMALGLMHALHERGRRLPDEMSIVGFDDTPESGNFWPPLTSVHQNFAEVGVQALRALITLIERGEVADPVIVPTTLVVRGSTTTPPAL